MRRDTSAVDRDRADADCRGSRILARRRPVWPRRPFHRKYPSEHVHYEAFRFPEDGAALKGLFSTLERSYDRGTVVFALPHERLLVEVYPDIKSYHKRTFGEGSPDWMVGNFDPDEGTIRLVSPNHPGSFHNHDGILSIAVHEFVHSVLFAYRDGTSEGLPVWLDEGIALYYAGQITDNDRKHIQKIAAAGKMPTLKNLEEDFVKFGGYTFSGSAVEFIVKKYGEEKLRRFVKTPSSYEEIFGVSQANLSAAWQEYIKGIAGTLF